MDQYSIESVLVGVITLKKQKIHKLYAITTTYSVVKLYLLIAVGTVGCAQDPLVADQRTTAAPRLLLVRFGTITN